MRRTDDALTAASSGPVGWVAVAVSTAPGDVEEALQSRFMVLAAMFVAVLSAGIVYLAVGAWTRLDRLIDASERMSKGQFDEKLDEGAGDEIGRLSTAYDQNAAGD